jgi:hypothetical protein
MSDCIPTRVAVGLVLLQCAACSGHTAPGPEHPAGRGAAAVGGVGGRASAGAGGSVANAGSAAGRSGADAGVSQAGGNAAGAAAAADGGELTRWRPTPGSTWQYQLSGTLDSTVDAQVYDLDLYETSSDDIKALHDQQRKVVCYFDTAYEPGRSDSKALEPYKGNPVDGWPGQYWLDVRAPAVFDVMLARIALAQTKHCDGVEADDVDARSNDPGFPLTAADQQGFIIKISDAAHAHGLAFGLKNDLDEVSALVDHAEFAINEQCFEYEECDSLTPFLRASKPVFNVEYTDGNLTSLGNSICPQAKMAGLSSVIKHLELGPERYGCR